MKKIVRIIETYEEFINENATGAATYGVTWDSSTSGSVGPEFMELFNSLAKNAVNIMDQRVWAAVVHAVDICRDEVVSKLKSDGHKIWQDSTRLAKEFIEQYGEDYVTTFLKSRVQS